jgi:hypothetical protein
VAIQVQNSILISFAGWLFQGKKKAKVPKHVNQMHGNLEPGRTFKIVSNLNSIAGEFFALFAGEKLHHKF